MIILYFSYWSINDGITHGSVFPTISILDAHPNVNKIILVTIERDKKKLNLPEQIKSLKKLELNLIEINNSSKIKEYVTIYKTLKKIIHKHSPDTLIGRSAFTAFHLSLLKKEKHILITESFEPHHLYMTSLKKWRKNGLKYLIYKYMHNNVANNSDYLLTVSKNYANILQGNNVLTIPCTVNIENFRFNKQHRDLIRNKLRINSNDIVGIYVGKFNDIYWNLSDIQQFLAPFFNIPNFKLLILTNTDKTTVYSYFNIEERKKTYIIHAQHTDVPKYLSAADFAFSFINSTESSMFCSPIKHGEYLSSGLPIITLPNIGDDSDMIKKHNFGIIIEKKEISQKKIDELFELLNIDRNERSINFSSKLSKYRGQQLLFNFYNNILNRK